jgi:hypothetical protein
MPKAKTATFGQRGFAIEMPKASTYLKDPVVKIYDEDSSSYDFRETDEFKRYRALVEKTLKRFKLPATFREINTALGDSLIRHWTADALETSNNVLWFKGYIDRFLWIQAAHKPEPIYWNGSLNISGKPKSLRADLGLEGRVTA